jgi:hypothetical protein
MDKANINGYEMESYLIIFDGYPFISKKDIQDIHSCPNLYPSKISLGYLIIRISQDISGYLRISQWDKLPDDCEQCEALAYQVG